MKVALCGLIYSSNLGEEMIADSVRYMINDVSKETIEFVELDIRGIDSRPLAVAHAGENLNTMMASDKAKHSIKHMLRIFVKSRSSKMIHYLKRIRSDFFWKFSSHKRKKLEDFFGRSFIGVHLIVVAGGGLIEWKNNEYQDYLFTLAAVAEQLHIPVVYNAVGCVGGYDIKDSRCRRMKAALTSESIKHISVRDHVDVMNQFVDFNQAVPQIADPAVWIAEAYGIKKAKESNVIGIGLIRGSIYESYGYNNNKNEMFILYQQIIQEVEARGYQWKLFSTGFEVDQKAGEELLDFMGKSHELLIPRPDNAKEVMQSIAQFRGIVTYRLHSCISAYSLDVPFIAISWNNKADEFLRLIGYPERVFAFSQANAIKVVDALEKSIEDGYDAASREKIRQKSKENVRTWLRNMDSKNA